MEINLFEIGNNIKEVITNGFLYVVVLIGLVHRFIKTYWIRKYKPELDALQQTKGWDKGIVPEGWAIKYGKDEK